MLTAYNRHLILLFVVGFIWGYVLKVFTGAFFYIGWNDPSAVNLFPYLNF